jgi:hypothetical protein
VSIQEGHKCCVNGIHFSVLAAFCKNIIKQIAVVPILQFCLIKYLSVLEENPNQKCSVNLVALKGPEAL